MAKMKGAYIMKKTLSAVLVCVLLACTLLTLVSCGKSLVGTYTADIAVAKVTYEFAAGGKVTKTTDPFIGNNVVEEGKYEFNKDGDEITFTFGEESSTHSFVEGEEGDVKYIKIDGVKLTKAD